MDKTELLARKEHRIYSKKCPIRPFQQMALSKFKQFAELPLLSLRFPVPWEMPGLPGRLFFAGACFSPRFSL
jgi:hypothetical protein